MTWMDVPGDKLYEPVAGMVRKPFYSERIRISALFPLERYDEGFGAHSSDCEQGRPGEIRRVYARFWLGRIGGWGRGNSAGGRGCVRGECAFRKF